MPEAEAVVAQTSAPVAPAEAPVEMSIEDYNKALEAEINAEPQPNILRDVTSGNGEVQEIENPTVDNLGAPADPAPIPEPALIEAEAEAKDTPEEPAIAETDTSLTDSQFKLGADVPIEEFAEQKEAYLKTVEITPELQSILDRQEAEITAAKSVVAEIDNIANKDSLMKIGSAMNRLFETEVVDGGEIKVNAEPLVSLLRTDFKNEFRHIATEMLSTDSDKYAGASLYQEFMIDQFGSEKAGKMMAYGFADTPLPVMPSGMLPQGLDEKNKEYYFQLPEVKKFQIQGLVEEVNDFQKELADRDTPEWRKEEIVNVADNDSLPNKRAMLEAEFKSIQDGQRIIESDRNNAETQRRQQAEAAANFRTKVNAQYNKEIFELADIFAADLAPRLTYADTDTQLSQAHNVMARIGNALSDDPMADYYANQLKSEGVQFDFGKGRDLLHTYYQSVELLTSLKDGNASPQRITLAEHKHRQILFDLKVEQKSLIGQLSSKYVKSNGTALSKQVDTITAKKQAVKTITNGKPHTDRTKDSPEKLAKDIADYNRRIAAANPEEMYEQYNQ